MSGYTKLALLPNERGPMICKSPPTSTVTFFRGPTSEAERYLVKRVAAIVAANPWLASVLAKDPDGGELTAYYPPDVPPRAHFRRRDDLVLSQRDASYHAMVTGLGDALCKTSEASVGNDAQLWRVSLIPDADEPEDSFALVVSCNHSLLDGHGYYKIYGMLSRDAKVEALSPVRKQELPSRILEAMGGECSLMTAAPAGFLLRFMGGMLRNALFPATRCLGFFVDETWIEREKTAVRRDQSDEVRYVSTNDIIVSAFFRSCEADCASMAMNFRGKIEACEERDVGNYEDLVTYMPADFATPALIRKSVDRAPYTRASSPRTNMLTNWQHLSARYSVITNWATFSRPLVINDTEQLLHLPLFDFPKSTPASVLASMVIFKPHGGGREVACLCGGDQATLDRIRASGMVGRPLGMSM